jgi:hypothetical protein
MAPYMKKEELSELGKFKIWSWATKGGPDTKKN